VLREVREELDERYGVLNTEAKEAQSLKSNIEKERKNLIKLQEKKVNIQTKLEEMKHKIKMNKEEEGRLSQLKEDLEEIDGIIGRTNGSIKSWEKNIKANEIERNDCKKAMERFLKEFPNIDDIVSKIENRIKVLEEELTNEDTGIYNEINTVEKEISSAENNIEGNECLSCGRSFSQKEKTQRLQLLNKQKDTLSIKVRKIERELSDLNEEKTDTKERRNSEYYDNKQLVDNLDSEIRDNTDKIRDAQDVIKRKTVELTKKKEAMELVKSTVDPKIKVLLEDEESLSMQVNAIVKNVSEYEESYGLVASSGQEASVIKGRYEFLKRIETLVKEELANLKNVVKDNFNKKIMQVYKKLGFKDFKNIEIDSTFSIKVNRKGKEQQLNRLSTSERVTLGVLVMLVGKEEYLPDYPFFVLDEVTTAYDPARFKKIIDYLANETKTKYTIVTAFSPTGDKIKVEHKLGGE